MATIDDEVLEPQTLVRNSSTMLLARLVALVCGGALTVFAVSRLSVTDYGRYATATALITLFALLSEMGITSLAVRQMVASPERSREVFALALGAEVATTVVAIALMVVVVLALGYPAIVLELVAIGSVGLMFQAPYAAIEAALKARRVMGFAALALAAQAVVNAAVGFALIAAGAGPRGLLVAISAGSAALLVTGVVALRARLRLSMAAEVRPGPLWHFVRAGSMIALTGAITVIYERIDVLMLSKLDRASAVAHYSLPFQIVQYVLLIPTIVGTAFFPLLAETLKADAEAARTQFLTLLRVFIFISTPAAIGLMLAGPEILTLIFGHRYDGSTGPLHVFAWVCLLGFLNALFWYAILASYRERAMALLMAGGLVVNVALNALLIPPYGPTGAAVALVASYVVIVCGQGVLIQRGLFELPWGAIAAKPLVAGVVAAIVAVPLAQVSDIAAGAAGALAFAAALLLMRYISAEEWAPLTGPVRTFFARGG